MKENKTEELTIPKKRRIDQISHLEEVEIAKINVGVRPSTKRYSEGEWKAFLESLATYDVINPIALLKYDEPFEGYTHYLLAGWHRLTGVKELGKTKIKAHVYPHDLSGDEIIAIRYRDNIDRKDLTPDQKAYEINEFYETCLLLYGKKTSTSKEASGISIRDVASMLGMGVSTVSEAINAHKIFTAVPDLKKVVKTKKDLNRIIKNADRAVKREEAMKVVEKRLEEEGGKSKTGLQELISKWYILSDGIIGLQETKSESVDLLEYDPPYPIRSDDRVIQGVNTQEAQIKGDYKAITPEEFEVQFRTVTKEAFRVLKPEGWAIIWFGYEYFFAIQQWLKEARFLPPVENGNLLPQFLHGKWYKGQGFSHTSNPEHTLGHTIEPFLYLKKTKAARIIKPHADVFEYPPNSHAAKVNPHEKPVALYEEIFSTFTHEGSYIMSICTGSGNSLLAAANLGCIARGYDLSEEQQKGYIVNAFNQTPPNYGRK